MLALLNPNPNPNPDPNPDRNPNRNHNPKQEWLSYSHGAADSAPASHAVTRDSAASALAPASATGEAAAQPPTLDAPSSTVATLDGAVRLDGAVPLGCPWRHEAPRGRAPDGGRDGDHDGGRDGGREGGREGGRLLGPPGESTPPPSPWTCSLRASPEYPRATSPTAAAAAAATAAAAVRESSTNPFSPDYAPPLRHTTDDHHTAIRPGLQRHTEPAGGGRARADAEHDRSSSAPPPG